MDRILNDFFTQTQEKMIKEKLDFLRFLTKDIAFNLRLSEKYNEHNKMVFCLNCIIENERKYIKSLWESIHFNKELIGEGKRYNCNIV